MRDKVQFWIDIIQARAPGSTILVVATHIDSVIEKQKIERIQALKIFLENEVLRLVKD